MDDIKESISQNIPIILLVLGTFATFSIIVIGTAILWVLTNKPK